MSLIEDLPFKQRACSEGEHEIVRDDQGYRVCERCGLSTQTLVDVVGGTIFDSVNISGL